MDPSAGATHAGPVAHGPAAHPGMEGLQIPLAITGAEPLLQHQGGLGRISYDTDDREMSHQQMNGGSRSGGSALLGRKHAPDRRPLRFWQPFNDWWRSELDRVGRRPTSHEIGDWYVASADSVWGNTKPTVQETRVHAKCLRSLPLVRDYFRNYRAKKRGVQGEGVDGDDDGDTEDGADNASGHRNRRAKIQAVQDDPEMQAVIANMAQMSPMEMMQMQSAGMMLPQQFWAGAMAAMDGHDADDYARAIMMQQHLQAAMLQHQMAAAAVAAQQFAGQQFGVFAAPDDDDDDEEDTEPGDGHAAAANEPADAGTEIISTLAPRVLTAATSVDGHFHIAGSGAMSLASENPITEAHHSVYVTNAALETAVPARSPAAPAPEAGASIVDSMLVDLDTPKHSTNTTTPPAKQAADDQHSAEAALAHLHQQHQQHLQLSSQDNGLGIAQHLGHEELAAAQEAKTTAGMHGFGSGSALPPKVDVMCKPHQHPHKQRDLQEELGQPACCAAMTGTCHSSIDAPMLIKADHSMQRPEGVHMTAPVCSSIAVATSGPMQQMLPLDHSENVAGLHLCDAGTRQGSSIVAEQPRLAARIATGAAALTKHHMVDVPRPHDHEEVSLLATVQLQGMSQEAMIAHVKAVQEELVAKRELLKRSFDQLRRTQERLGRRERKLAKEQQKCRQYQQALSVWQASLVPMTDPVAQELYQAQMQVAMTAQASAVQQAAAAAGAAAPPTAQ